MASITCTSRVASRSDPDAAPPAVAAATDPSDPSAHASRVARGDKAQTGGHAAVWSVTSTKEWLSRGAGAQPSYSSLIAPAPGETARHDSSAESNTKIAPRWRRDGSPVTMAKRRCGHAAERHCRARGSEVAPPFVDGVGMGSGLRRDGRATPSRFAVTSSGPAALEAPGKKGDGVMMVAAAENPSDVGAGPVTGRRDQRRVAPSRTNTGEKVRYCVELSPPNTT
mmetsp:Transcript_26757/g.100630  ORF Transcript_26757/g.100630 Transcript_26757/m.100630 type:complete len:225 (+) Transcript_26757:839-1513(+)